MTLALLPWNPIAIVWLGLLFTPMWAGVMAAINGRRLGTLGAAWVPLTIGFGYLAVDLLAGLVVDWYWLSVLFYGGAVWLLWSTVLRSQQEAFARSEAARAGRTGRWVWPAVAGAPLALLAFLGFVVEPLRPLEPRQVCERFARASSLSEMSKYTTAKLRPACEALARLGDTGDPVAFELTDEASAPPDFGGYLVGHRTVFNDGGRRRVAEGVFHLVNWDGAWKIEDMYFIQFDGQPLEQWVALSTDYPVMLNRQNTGRAAASAPTGGTGVGAGQPAGTNDKPWLEQNRGAVRAVAFGTSKLLANGGGKKIGTGVMAVLAAIGGGLVAFWRRMTGEKA